MRALGPRAALLLLLAARSAARRLDDESCHDVFGNCAAYVAAGHTCEASFCERLRLGRAMRRVLRRLWRRVQRHLRPLPGVHRHVGGELFGLVL